MFSRVWLALALSSCASGIGTSPDVVVDKDFGLDMDGALAGVHAWDQLGISPRVKLEEHAAMRGVDVPPNTIYIFAVHGMSGSPALTVRANGGATTAIDVDYLRANTEASFKRAAGHEMGHALGLRHDQGEDSLMLGRYQGAEVPSCEDAIALSAELGTTVPAACPH